MHLVHQFLNGSEPPLRTQPFDELQPQLFPVEIALEIEDMGLHQPLPLAEGGTSPHISHRGMVLSPPLNAHGIYPIGGDHPLLWHL